MIHHLQNLLLIPVLLEEKSELLLLSDNIFIVMPRSIRLALNFVKINIVPNEITSIVRMHKLMTNAGDSPLRTINFVIVSIIREKAPLPSISSTPSTAISGGTTIIEKGISTNIK